MPRSRPPRCIACGAPLFGRDPDDPVELCDDCLDDLPYEDEDEDERGRGRYADRLLPGSVILDEPATPPSVWGTDDIVLWAQGEALIICGPDGTGKTTLAGNLVRARLGLGDGLVLGHAVDRGKGSVLYLAMDRPRQARRSLRRLFTAADRYLLDERLVVWQGPPPVDLARYPAILAELAAEAHADTIVVDSLKDAALELAKDETGSGWNRARQLAIAGGAELIELHHPRKAQADNKRPSKIEDIYGSRWITAGAGSIIVLWGEAGDVVVEFSHLKPPGIAAAPFLMGIDQIAGTVHIEQNAIDLVDQIKQRGSHGITADVAARLVSGSDKPTANEIKKARYKLDRLTASGMLVRLGSGQGGGKDREVATWYLASTKTNDEQP